MRCRDCGREAELIEDETDTPYCWACFDSPPTSNLFEGFRLGTMIAAVLGG